MALDLLYIDEAITFPDWEHGDARAESFEPETYSPALSFIFLWKIRDQLGADAFKKVEEEFRQEIGVDKYNKKGWMQNKPALFKIIKKHAKGKKAKVASVETSKHDEVVDSDDEVDIEMDDGMILKVQPKFRGNGATWKKNFTKKFNLQQAGNNKWQRRPQQQNQQQQRQRPSHQGNRNNNGNYNRNTADQQKRDTPSPDQWWRCQKCRNDGNPKSYKGNQMCPIHNFRPKWFDSIPIASVKSARPHNNENDDDDFNTGGGQLASIRQCFLYDEDSSHSS